jgi:hypothetical protein
MKMRFCLVSVLAGLAGLVIGGCVIQQPVYTSPPPVAGGPSGVVGVGRGVDFTAPLPAPGINAPMLTAPGNVPEPPAGTAVTASIPPPTAPQVEVGPQPPGPDYVWAAGYWNWNGAAWIWAPGGWVLPPFRGAVWLGGRWGYRGGRAYWARGRWR